MVFQKDGPDIEEMIHMAYPNAIKRPVTGFVNIQFSAIPTMNPTHGFPR